MLSPAQVSRFARQILVADVGKAGQERLLGATLRAFGRGPALNAALELLRAAGVRVVDGSPGGSAEACGAARRVEPDVGGIRLGTSAFADNRLGCQECLDAFFAAQPEVPPAEAPAVAFAVGAAAASELILAILDRDRAPLAMTFAPAPAVATVPRRPGCTCQSA